MKTRKLILAALVATVCTQTPVFGGPIQRKLDEAKDYNDKQKEEHQTAQNRKNDAEKRNNAYRSAIAHLKTQIAEMNNKINQSKQPQEQKQV